MNRTWSDLVPVLCLLGVFGCASSTTAEPEETSDTTDDAGGGSSGTDAPIDTEEWVGGTYSFSSADDWDDDGYADDKDNCPFVSNRDQADSDGDGIGDACDSCAAAANDDQSDLDGDLIGDVCDDDMDGDSIQNNDDICPGAPDPLQWDADGDGQGDLCDGDMDDDGIDNEDDNCPLIENPGQADDDPVTFGDACLNDYDGDGIRNGSLIGDNCPVVANPEQEDVDGDGIGDACDPDLDEDGIVNKLDNCATNHNPDQADADRDNVGDVCDPNYCVVIHGDLKNCLDPNDPFTVYTTPLSIKTGEGALLRLFTNRPEGVISYRWAISDAPEDARCALVQEEGQAPPTGWYELHYSEEASPKLIAMTPGRYELTVTATLEGEDPQTGSMNPTADRSVSVDVLY